MTLLLGVQLLPKLLQRLRLRLPQILLPLELQQRMLLLLIELLLLTQGCQQLL